MTRLSEIEESLESTIYYNSPNRHIDDLQYLIDKCKRLEKVREAAEVFVKQYQVSFEVRGGLFGRSTTMIGVWDMLGGLKDALKEAKEPE